MGKVDKTKIIMINKAKAPVVIAKESEFKPAPPMHLNEEMVLVFDENGNVVGNVGHKEVEDLF